MKVICGTWFLPADYCGCAKCTGVTPPRPKEETDSTSSFTPLTLNQLGTALATVANMERGEA